MKQKHETINFEYQFIFPDGEKKTFNVCLNDESLESEQLTSEVYPEWTQLEVCQCDNCPLSSNQSPYCPLAVSLVPIVSWSKELASYEEIDVRVITDEREVFAHTSLQRALSSLLGLIMSTSACPKMTFLRPLARFHLPLASQEETIYRAVSMHFLRNYFDQEKHLSDEQVLSDLKRHYDEIQVLNTYMAKRLRQIIKRDAAVNALVLLDILSRKVTFSIDGSLQQIRYLFHDESNVA